MTISSGDWIITRFHPPSSAPPFFPDIRAHNKAHLRILLHSESVIQGGRRLGKRAAGTDHAQLQENHVFQATQKRRRHSNMGKGKYTLRSIIVRCVVIMVGVFITAYGAEAFVLANLGSDPVTAFVQGLSKVLPFVHGDFGMAMNVFNVLCFVVILIVYRKGIGVATVLYTFTLGTFCSMMEPWIIALIGPAPSMVTRVILVITGTLALGVGLGSYQAAGYGAGPSDGFNQFMAKTLKMKLKWWRMIFDAIMVVGALIMGGVIHVATLVGMFCVGPVLGPVLNKLSPLVNKWAGNEDLAYEEI
jgi:uncharacterized membrane protein YczE